MHVGLNLVFLTPGAQGGMETYARELVPELVASAPDVRFTTFVGRDAAGAGPWSELTDEVVLPVSARSRIGWVRGEQQLLPRAAARTGVDLVHSFASTAPAWGPFRKVVTVHDLIYQTLPRAHPGLRALGMRVLVPLGARRSDRVIADSQATAADLKRFVHLPDERIDVIPLGLGSRRVQGDAAAVAAALGPGAATRPLLLSVSAKLAHKNLAALIEALARLPAATRPLLVLPGYPTPHEAVLREQAVGLGVADDIRFLGWVSAAQLQGLYESATAFIFPTLAEGFGLPVLEAMARGVPVACSDIPVLHEVAGNQAQYFDPHSPDAIAASISRLLGDGELRGRLAAGGPAQARRFSWRRTAEMTLASYRRACP